MLSLEKSYKKADCKSAKNKYIFKSVDWVIIK